MEFHLFLPQMRMSMEAIVERAQAAEAAGFGGIAFMDHLAPPAAEGHPMFDAMATAAWVAADTSRLQVGHLVLCDAFRQPAVLAREIVTLDHASGGRFELGIGSGSVSAELTRFGVDIEGRRVERLGETLDVLKLLWSGERVDYDGRFHRLKGAQQIPAPTRPIPILIGGAGPKTMALVARHASWWNLPGNEAHRLADLRPAAGSARASLQTIVGYVGDESRREDVTAGALIHAHVQRTNSAGPEGSEVGLSGVDARHDRLGVGQKHLARFRQRDRARSARAVDEPLTHDAFEGCDLLAHGRLGISEMLGRAAERPLGGDRLKGREMPELEAQPLIRLANHKQ